VTRRLPPSLLWGGGLVALLLVTTTAAPFLAAYDPAEQLDPPAAAYRPPGTELAAVRLAGGVWRLADRVRRTPDGLEIERLGKTETFSAPEVMNLTPEGVADRRLFLLGSDRFGRDVLSRILYGARVSMAVGLLSMFLALTLGIAIGSLAALGGRIADTVLMRGVDALLSFPSLFLLLALTTFLGHDPRLTVVILGSTAWPTVSRLIRAELLGLKERDFVLAARTIGQHPLAIFWRHLLPNAFTPVLIQATLLVGSLILAESSLSFLGLGIQPPIPSWGNLIAEGRDVLTSAWWISVFPGAVLAITVIAFNLFADGLRDRLDPRNQT
jgi:peptide/nickel transport system permease protein